ncbi:MAG: hypothetical protein AB7U82_10145 [Blastocatellales bacterium]
MLTRFLLYGFLGWCVEVFWSAIEDAWRKGLRDWRLRGQSYLWSFPLYGLAALLFEPLHDAIRALPWVARGMIYVAAIWVVEYTAGWMLKRSVGACPWDYTCCRHHLHGLISWDYFPLWFVFGFILEYLHDRFVALTPHIVAAFGF